VLRAGPAIRRALDGAIGIACFAIGSAAVAEILSVRVLDEHGAPVAGVAVDAVRHGDPQPSAPRPPAIMDQAGKEFVPHMLAIQAGSEVHFPNNDSVSHHVYSFSDAKTFELALYKGDVHSPVRFDTPGVVVLGCNIHDGMLGYIRVVATPHYGFTDAHGSIELDGLAAGVYTVEAWTPRARPTALPEPIDVEIRAGERAALEVVLRGKLSPEHAHGGASLSWERY
jgi:plastocyanin